MVDTHDIPADVLAEIQDSNITLRSADPDPDFISRQAGRVLDNFGHSEKPVKGERDVFETTLLANALEQAVVGNFLNYGKAFERAEAYGIEHPESKTFELVQYMASAGIDALSAESTLGMTFEEYAQSQQHSTAEQKTPGRQR